MSAAQKVPPLAEREQPALSKTLPFPRALDRRCALYDDELYPDWESHEFAHLDDGARERVEVLWLNPACAAALRASEDQGSLEIIGR